MDPLLDLTKLSSAWSSKNWPVVSAFVILTLVRLSKTPVMGKVWGRIPTSMRPLVPALLGVLSGLGDALVTGKPMAVSLIYGLMSGLLAIGVDQAVTKPSKPLLVKMSASRMSSEEPPTCKSKKTLEHDKSACCAEIAPPVSIETSEAETTAKKDETIDKA